MSISAPGAGLGWRLLPAAVAVAVMVVVASLAIAALRGEPMVGGLGTSGDDLVAVEHAPWDIKISAVARGGKLTKREQARLAAQRTRVRGAVMEVVDTALLDPAALLKVTKARFTRPAAAAFANARLAPPERATAVTAKKRSARIGIQARRPNQAAAAVKVRLKADVGAKSLRWTQQMTLWLALDDGRWKVIGFDAKRRSRR